MSLIELQNIYKRFIIKKSRSELLLHPFRKRFKEVLKDINIKIDQNGIYSLVGPNGSGKTTLLRIICGILFPDSGKLLINNSPFYLNPHIVFLISESDKGFFPRLSLNDNLLFFASLMSNNRKEAKEHTDFLINQFELTAERDTRFQELSSGTRQRLSIARAMLFDPQIILFDEITKGIDLKQQQLIYSLIRKLQASGKTIIFATHLLNEIEALSDIVILINEGRILRFAPYKDIRSDIKKVFNIL
ncbi:MAG: ABC transporter ATP-binding protein [Myxococcota bacterium]